ncbi:MAG: chemotaxis protein CheB [Verrucomicrobia bacterium]|nr:chemotaxis protein CheB [Verrucomicrobiota bacterium]
MSGKDIIVIGTSTGGSEALQVVVSGLPADLRAALFIVLHISADGLGILPDTLARAGRLPASNAQNWEAIRPGRIYVAPPDHHLLLERSGHVRITRGPRENRFRPAVDPLFRSAAHAFGPRVAGVVLTGGLDDGTAGLWTIKDRGGTTIVQDPDAALAPSMPRNTLEHVTVDHCVPLEEIAPLLVRLSLQPAETGPAGPGSKLLETEVSIAKEDNALEVGIMEWGTPSLYACPECRGVLFQLEEGSNLRFRCHTGHAYSLETLPAEFSERMEETLWNAVRSMEESMLLMQRMADRLSEHNHDQAAQRLLHEAQRTQQNADVIRQLVTGPFRLSESPVR